MKQVHNLRALERQLGFSQVVRAGDFLFLSGVVSWDADGQALAVGDMAAQLRNIYGEIRDTLATHGASLADVVRETVYTTDADALVGALAERAAFYEGIEPPAATLVQVARLLHPDFLLEVEITAMTA